MNKSTINEIVSWCTVIKLLSEKNTIINGSTIAHDYTTGIVSQYIYRDIVFEIQRDDIMCSLTIWLNVDNLVVPDMIKVFWGYTINLSGNWLNSRQNGSPSWYLENRPTEIKDIILNLLNDFIRHSIPVLKQVENEELELVEKENKAICDFISKFKKQ